MNKLLFGLAGLIALAFVSPAEAACGGGASACFVVAAGGNSGTAATWSATSGGATCSGTTCATGPAATDTVCLDSAGGNLTINAALSVANLLADGVNSAPCSGASGTSYSGKTLAINSGQTLTIRSTTFKLVSGMTVTAASSSSTVAFTDATASDVVLITNATRSLGAMTFGTASSGSTTYRFVDKPTLSGIITLTGGTLDASTNNVDVQADSVVIGGNSNTRAFNGGTGTWTLTKAAAGTIFDCTTTTGLTIAMGSTNFTVANSLTGNVTFVGCGNNTTAGSSLGNWTFQNTGTGNSTYNPSVASFWNNLILNGRTYFNMTSGQAFTVNGTLTITGTSSAPVEIANSANGNTANTITITNAATANWVIFRGATFATSAMTATNCFNMGTNNFNGGSCNAPVVGGAIVYAH